MSAWKPTRLRAGRPLQQLDHALPAVHAAPADLAFGGEPFAVILRRCRGLLESLGDPLRVALPDPSPSRRDSRRSRCGRRRTCEPRGRAAFGRSRQAFRTCVEELLSLGLARPLPTRRRSAARPARRPSRRRALCGRSCRPAASGRRRSQSMLDVRIEEKQIDAVELDAVDLGRRR